LRGYLDLNELGVGLVQLELILERLGLSGVDTLLALRQLALIGITIDRQYKNWMIMKNAGKCEILIVTIGKNEQNEIKKNT
jgi:hypothetical protein